MLLARGTFFSITIIERIGGTSILAGTGSFQLSNQGEIDLLFQEIEICYCDGDEYFGKH